MSGNITCTGSLPVGILFDGKLHQDVVLGLATVGDEIAVIEDGVSDAGVPIAVLARTLTKIGDIPAQSITYELLCDNLVSEDYAYLRTLRDEVKKSSNPRAALHRIPVHGYPARTIRHLRRKNPTRQHCRAGRMAGRHHPPGKPQSLAEKPHRYQPASPPQQGTQRCFPLRGLPRGP